MNLEEFLQKQQEQSENALLLRRESKHKARARMPKVNAEQLKKEARKRQKAARKAQR